MNSKAIVRTATLLAALCVSVPVFAKPFVKTISITQTAKVGQVTLKAGAYQLSIEDNKVSVQRGKDQVAQSEGRWKNAMPSPTTTQCCSVKMPGEGSAFCRTETRFVFSE